MTTEKQRRAVAFCERWLNIKFNENVNDFEKVSRFLSINLDYAKAIYIDAYCSYQGFMNDLD